MSYKEWSHDSIEIQAKKNGVRGAISGECVETTGPSDPLKASRLPLPVPIL
jgi:hypothetical protein